ncbi:MAG: hypothetical protein WC764_04365 [Candidatus Paceibacterota bacterium]|jgi:hypothetical protein
MSSQTELDIVIRAKDEASKVFGKMKVDLKELGMAMAGVGTAITGALGLAVKAAGEGIKQNAQLEAVLKSTKGAVGLTADEIKRMASELQKTTTVEDEAIQAGQNMLLSFTHIGKEVFPTATAALLDMATAMNDGATPSASQLSSQAIQLGKALNNPVDGISALTRVGVAFTDQQKAQIEAMVKAGDVAGAQKIILAELAVEFGGRSTAAAKTFEGQLLQLKNTWGDIVEEIGMKVIPILQKLVDFIKPILDKMAIWLEKNPQLVDILIKTALVLGPLLILIPALTIALAALLSPIGLIIIAVGGLVFAGVTLAENWDALKISAEMNWNLIKNTIIGALDEIKNAVSTMVSIAFPKLSAFITLANTAIAAVNKVTGTNIGSIPGGISVPKMAKGGIVTSPTLAMIGESGAEAVVPLSRGGGFGTTVNISIGSFFGGDPERAAREIGDLIIKRLQLNASVS